VKLSDRGWLFCVKAVFANIHVVLRIHINISYLSVQMIHIFTFKTFFETNPLIVLFSLEYLETENNVVSILSSAWNNLTSTEWVFIK